MRSSGVNVIRVSIGRSVALGMLQGPRALIENREQPHATNNAGGIIASDGKAMPRQDPEWRAVPISKPQSLPNARRRTRVGRAKR
jgi:hypothetical protein